MQTPLQVVCDGVGHSPFPTSSPALLRLCVRLLLIALGLRGGDNKIDSTWELGREDSGTHPEPKKPAIQQGPRWLECPLESS